MARRPLTKPRKTASQERSRLTVNALVESTIRVLVKEGYDRASTNKIAAVAGVSIGSLYQYFPSKEALVAAVIDRHTSELSLTIRDALAQTQNFKGASGTISYKPGERIPSKSVALIQVKDGKFNLLDVVVPEKVPAP